MATSKPCTPISIGNRVGQRTVRQGDWKAYYSKGTGWELYDLGDDVEEKIDVATDHPDTLKKLTALAKAAHEPIRPGEIYDRKLIDQDRRQAPHQRNRKPTEAK